MAINKRNAKYENGNKSFLARLNTRRKTTDKGDIKMSKYIVRNCPAIYKKFRINENNELYIDEYRCKYQPSHPCQDYNYCVMKRIVDYCLDNEKYGDEYYTRPILEKLDIQEVE